MNKKLVNNMVNLFVYIEPFVACLLACVRVCLRARAALPIFIDRFQQGWRCRSAIENVR